MPPPEARDPIFNDSPIAIPLPASADTKVTDSFDNYLMWMPNTPNAIFVSIAHVTWSWSAEAILNEQNALVLSPNNPPVTPDPQQAATATFPLWNSNVTNTNCGTGR